MTNSEHDAMAYATRYKGTLHDELDDFGVGARSVIYETESEHDGAEVIVRTVALVNGEQYGMEHAFADDGSHADMGMIDYASFSAERQAKWMVEAICDDVTTAPEEADITPDES